MFIKNPNQKVSYSFRIYPELLENLKGYAKATNKSLPETINDLLEESIKGINTNNIFVNDLDGVIINIPLMYHKIKYPIKNNFEITNKELVKGTKNYLDFDKKGFVYEIKKIPNNLDTWDKTVGYCCNEKGVLHKGVNLVIVPELILNPELYITDESILNCLKFLYFQVDSNDKKINVININYKQCLNFLKEAGNEEVLSNFNGIYNKFYKFTVSFINEFNKDPEANKRYDYYRVRLYEELVKYANKYNDNTIINLEKHTVFNSKDDDDTEIENNENITFKSLTFTTDSILTEILEENQFLQNKITELEKNFNEMSNIVDKLEELKKLAENEEERNKTWEELKKEK